VNYLVATENPWGCSQFQNLSGTGFGKSKADVKSKIKDLN
jgi:hypothetical protein